MATPKSIILEGDVDILTHSNVNDGGDGSLKVASKLLVSSTTEATTYDTAAAVFAGGVGVAKKVFLNSTLDVQGHTTLDQVSIDTTDGNFSITGSNGISATPAGAISFTSSADDVSLTASGSGRTITLTSSGTTSLTSSGGAINLNANNTSAYTVTGAFNLTHTSTLGRVILSSGKNTLDAITLNATNPAGGITASCGTTGMSFTSTGGPFAISGQNALSSLTLATNASAQDLYLHLTGATGSRIYLNSEGTGNDAVKFNASAGGITATCVNNFTTTVSAGSFSITGNNAASGLTLNTNGASQDLSFALTGETNSKISMASSGTGTGAITFTASNGGITSTSVSTYSNTVSAGPIVLSATGSSSSFTNTATNNGHDLSIAQAGNYQCRLVLSSTGTTADAIYMNASAGGIEFDAIKNFDVNVTTGYFSITSTGTTSSSSLLKHTSTGTSQNLKLELAGAFSNSLQIYSASTNVTDAIDIQATAGGINIDALEQIYIDSADTTQGIKIGYNSNSTPVYIGHTTSEVYVGQNMTVGGNLTVNGTATYINSEIVTIEDNVFIIHSGPTASTDTGILAKRYQTVDGTSNDVVTDTPDASGTAQDGSSTTITLASGSNASNDFYKNYWIKITGGTGVGQIRKIKSYVGSTKVATIYATGETDGLDFATAPDNTSTYSLYSHNFIASFFDESADEYVIGYAANDPGASPGMIAITEKPLVHLGEIDVDRKITVDTINEHSSNNGVTIETVNIKDGNLTNVGLINGNTVDITEQVTLTDAAGTANSVALTAPGTSGSYMIIVRSTGSSSCATFMLSKSVASQVGQVNRLTASVGVDSDLIHIEYPTNSKPKLYFQIAPGTGNKVFNCKTITV